VRDSLLDEIRIYNRLLSAGEVQADMNRGPWARAAGLATCRSSN